MSPAPTFDPYAVLQVAPSCEQEVIHAAFKALALKHHPGHDTSRRARDRMAELNRAYALVRDPSVRAAHDRSLPPTTPAPSVGAATVRSVGAPPPSSAASGSVLGFGRYAGWSLRDLARHDPEYLLWLSRHSSGIRYRTEIYSILGSPGRSAA